MKKLFTRLMLAAIGCALFVSPVSATTYIKDIAVAYAKHSTYSSTAKEKATKLLTDNGYTVADGILNQTVWGQVFLGYKTTEDYGEAITDIIVECNNSYPNGITINGKDFRPVTALALPGTTYQRAINWPSIEYDGNCNPYINAVPLYIHYSKSGRASGSPALTSLKIVFNESESNVGGYNGSSPATNENNDHLHQNMTRGNVGDTRGVFLHKEFANVPYKGKGTVDDPFQLTNLTDLTFFRDLVNSDAGDCRGICGKLMNDIDLSGINWVPIGRYNDKGGGYHGTFDGNYHVVSNLNGTSTDIHDMGFIGRGIGCTVKNMMIENAHLQGKWRSAPFIGSAYGNTTISYCGAFGNITFVNYANNAGLVYNETEEGNYVYVNNCFTSYSNLVGTNETYLKRTKIKFSCCDLANPDSTANRVRGFYCFYLNGNDNVSATWRQTLGVDAYPTLRSSSQPVYKTGIVYHNERQLFDGVGDGTENNPFQLQSETDLAFFKKLVNNDGYTTICAKMLTDIDYSAYTTVNDMIGTLGHPFAGLFDGGGKTIKIGFNVTEARAGLFRYINGAIIGNMQISGTLTTSQNIAGIVAGTAKGESYLGHIINKATIDCSFNGDASLGGFVGEIGDDVSAGAVNRVHFNNCGFRGSLLGANAYNCGGFAGWLYSNGYATAENCFFIPQQITLKPQALYTFIRCYARERYTVPNCYFKNCNYDFKAEDGQRQGNEVTEEAVKSGELCFKLNGSDNNSDTWLQTLKSDEYPTLWNSQRVYRFGEEYANYQTTLPGAGTLADPFLLSTPQELEFFRDLVNDGHPYLCAKLIANIDMSDRNWIPIGVYYTNTNYEIIDRAPYQGTFDGDGFIISNLSGITDGCHDMGLIGRAEDGCVVRNLLMHNVHLESLFRAATIIGYFNGIGSATVENCGVTGIIKFSCSKGGAADMGGIACSENGNLSVSNSFTTYSNIVGYLGGSQCTTTGSYCGTDVANWHATGELCYKLNGNKAGYYHWLQDIESENKQEYPQIRSGKKVGYENGKYHNIKFVDADNTTYSNPLASEDIQVVHHGGRLYEFRVTLGTSDGEIWHAFPDMVISFKANDSWTNIGELVNINRERQAFSGEWSGELKTIQGTFINGHTFQDQTPVFWMDYSGNPNKKQACLFWVAPENLTTLPIEFKFSSSDAQYNNLLMSKVAETVTAPTDGTVTLVTPTINTQTSVPGSQIGAVAFLSKVYSLAFWDGTDNRFISAQEVANGSQSMQFVLPAAERCHNIVALAYGEKLSTNGMGIDTAYVTYSYPFVQNPMHSIVRSNASATYNGSNTLQWAIAFPKDSDLFAVDPFVLYRAYQSNFSDAVQIDDMALDKYTSTTTENDSLLGWYTYSDSTMEGKSTKVKFDDTKSAFDDWNLTGQAKEILTAYKYPARYIYYKVGRSVPQSLWGDTKAFTKTWKVLLTNVLPRVDSIRVEKAQDFNKTHRVNLRLKLLNPLPYQLVPADEQQAVKDEAIKHGFTGSMFLWDEKAKIVIQRSSRTDEWYKNVDEVAKTIEVSGSQVKYNAAEGYYYVDIEDLQSAPLTHYYYEAWVDGGESDYPICNNMKGHVRTTEADANACFTETMAEIHNFAASIEEDDDVKISWGIDSSLPTTYTLMRQLYQCGYNQNQRMAASTDSSAVDSSSITLIEGKYDSNLYRDKSALAANAYQYTLDVTTTFRGHGYVQHATTYGSKKYTNGSISGYVRMPNGMAMPGNVKVRFTLVSPKTLKVNEVKTPNGARVLTGYAKDSLVYEVDAQTNGFYKIDSLCYYGTGMQYEVQAICGAAEFVGPSGSSNTFTVTMEDKKHNYSNIDFVCNNTYQFSGRILYANSTVPVSGMTFLVNGVTLHHTDGSKIVTDANGNFSFPVPRTLVKIQAAKKGHRLSGEGYILGGPNKDQREFVPTEDYDNLVLTDSTTVRLVGCVAGGETNGGTPIGFGKSKNIIGDDITLVLQLEGNNTAYLYFNNNNPEETSKNTTFEQVMQGATTNAIPTQVDFQSKRIIIKADNASGEFCLDLIPAKYKIAQIYASGYPTLMNEGQSVQILDLTEEGRDITVTCDGLTTSYNAVCHHVYHAPVEVTISQGNNDFMGEKTMTTNILSGTQTFDLEWSETIDGMQQTRYAFDYPVFQSNQNYGLTVRAQEVFYYNNDPQRGTKNTVLIKNRPATLINGFSSQTFKAEMLDSLGEACFSVTPSNTNFDFKGEDALKTLRAAVEIDGIIYESEPLKAYITGTRCLGTISNASISSKPKPIDIIRDPYGSESYAYREAGTSYSWTWNSEKIEKNYFEFGLSTGVYLSLNIGLGISTGSDFNLPALDFSLNKILSNDITRKDGLYTCTFNERICTSNDPHDVGAMADVYIGTMNTVNMSKYEAFSVVDEETYQLLEESRNNGSTKVICSGKNRDGALLYLLIGYALSPSAGESNMFVYSQKHILGTLIPELERQRNIVFRKAANKEQAEELAAKNKLTYYYFDDVNQEYQAVLPESNQELNTDSVSLYTLAIEGWRDLIGENEELKYEIQKKNDEQLKKQGTRKTYSIAGADIDHTEQASFYYRTVNLTGPNTIQISGGFNVGYQPTTGEGQVGLGAETSKKWKSGKYFGDNFAPEKRRAIRDRGRINGWGFLLDFDFDFGEDDSFTQTFNNFKTEIAGSGYHLSAKDNSTVDMDIYQVVDSTIIDYDSDLFKQYRDTINNYENGKDVGGYKKTTTDKNLISAVESYIHNYVFIQKGGATRNPWSDVDSSIVFTKNGNYVPLGERTLRIDNPKIYVDNPVVNNQPQDEAAIFTIRLANETEINDKSKYLNPSTLYLTVDEASNPDGAKLSIDGQPLRNGMQFYIDPGKSVTKTLEVRRGGKPYNYKDIKLQFTDNPDHWKLVSEATISVNYVPTSTPVNISHPANNWLMNTLSQKDSKGHYYIPVQIDGFSTTQYENFDHIELQYKKQTESEDQWVNLCSFYEKESLYNIAQGNKAMISSTGKINYSFYGETDPIEMKYDLRAVSFCRMGNGYVSRISNIVSGTKDTRCPEVFGKPKPANGILTFADVISLPFSEPVAYNYLDETVNFSVQGYTNTSDADHSAYIYFPGSQTQSAIADVDAAVNNGDLTIEMMVKAEKNAADIMNFISVENADANKSFRFGYMTAEDCLFAKLGSDTVKSQKVDICNAMTHVAFTYSADDSIPHFFVGQQEVGKANAALKKCACVAQGALQLGVNYKGSMSDVRIWGRVLSLHEIGSKYKTIVSTSERNLLAYWPMTETSGNVLVDKASGMNIKLTDVAWQTPRGYSVRLEGKPLELTSQAETKFARNNVEDFTLGFWFKCNGNKDNKNAMLFSAGRDQLMETGMDKIRIGFKDNDLVFISEGKTSSFGAKEDKLHDTWHHLAVSINHSLNVASLYIDGMMTNEMNADSIGGISSSYVAFGDTAFHGNIDNVTLWSMALPAAYINQYYNTDCTGREAELLINMNFEQTLANSQGSLYTAFSPYNNVIIKQTGQIAGEILVNEKIVNIDEKLYAPIRAGGGLQNLPFSWTSNGNELQININKTDASINNQQLNFVVRNIEDLNGNPMKNAQMWSVYVNRNVLAWDKDRVEMELNYGCDSIFTIGWKNTSGRVISYTIDNNANWLQLNNTMGTMQPLSSDQTYIRIDDGLAPGSYTTYINLIDENNLVSKLKLTVYVVAQEPDWNVENDSIYYGTMNVIGVVKKQTIDSIWVVDMNPYDIVAAFIDNKCMGKSYLKVDPATNSSHVYLSVRGNHNMKSKKIEFRLWSADEGKIYKLYTDSTLTYQGKTLVGLNNPLEMRTYNQKYQNIALKKGWNWISLNVKPANNVGANALFSDISRLTPGDLLKRSGQTFATLQSNGKWDDDLDNMRILPSNVYQIYAQNPCTVTAEGEAFTDNDREVEINFSKSNSWGDLAYLLEVSQPINVALSNFIAGSEKAPAGTIIKSREEFAVATKDGHWVGSLEYMRPGVGYYVQRTTNLTDVKIKVKYTNTIVSQSTSSSSTSTSSSTSSSSSYPTSMPIIATFAEGEYEEGDVLVAIANGEIVGAAVAKPTSMANGQLTANGQQPATEIFYLSASAENGSNIQFVKMRDGEPVAVSTKKFTYNADLVAGTLEHPYVVDFTATEGNDLYDLAGIKHFNLKTLNQRGIYIQNGRKVAR